MAKADQYLASVAWSEELLGVFTAGLSEIAGTDEVGGTFGHNSYDTLPTPIRIQVERGWAADLSAVEQGTMTLVLPDPDGDFNRMNTAGPLYADLDIMRPTKAEAVVGTTTYGLFAGFNDGVRHNPRSKRATITAVDFFERLTREQPTIAVVTSQRVDTIIGLILDAVAWTDPNDRDLDESRDVIPSWSADGTATALSLIQTLIATDLGWVFIDGSGVVCYRNRDVYYADSGPTVLPSPLRDDSLEIAIDKDALVNSQTVTRSGGVAQTATDAASIAKRGTFYGAAITSANLVDDGQAASLATFIVNLKATPRPPAWALGYRNVDLATLVQILTAEIGDLVQAPVDAAGNTITGRIQAIRHTVESGRLHDLRLTVRECGQTIFQLADSLVGGSAVIGY